jgi:hypothetical protein
VGVVGAREEEVVGRGLTGMVGTLPETGTTGLALPSLAEARQRTLWVGGGGPKSRAVGGGLEEEEGVSGCAARLVMPL